MAYCTVDDLKKKIDEATLIQLTDTSGAGVVDTIVTTQAIAWADALIDVHVSRVYQTPLAAPVPPLIVDLSATLAVASLHRFRSLDEPVWSNAAREMVELLEKIANGETPLEGAAPEPPSSGNSSATFTASARRFSRDLLEGY